MKTVHDRRNVRSIKWRCFQWPWVAPYPSTDARCLVIKLSGQCDIVDFALSSVAKSIGLSTYTCDTIPACDRHTVRHDDNIYSASVASRGKYLWKSACGVGPVNETGNVSLLLGCRSEIGVAHCEQRVYVELVKIRRKYSNLQRKQIKELHSIPIKPISEYICTYTTEIKDIVINTLITSADSVTLLVLLEAQNFFFAWVLTLVFLSCF